MFELNSVTLKFSISLVLNVMGSFFAAIITSQMHNFNFNTNKRMLSSCGIRTHIGSYVVSVPIPIPIPIFSGYKWKVYLYCDVFGVTNNDNQPKKGFWTNTGQDERVYWTNNSVTVNKWCTQLWLWVILMTNQIHESHVHLISGFQCLR